jgi:hypothetical protein
MPKKSRVLFLVGSPVLVICLISCSGSNQRNIADQYEFTKSIAQKQAVVGEEIKVVLTAVNKSSYNVEFFEIRKELKEGEFFVAGNKFIRCDGLKSGEKKTFSYIIIPASPGKKVIGPSKVVKIKLKEEDEDILLQENVGLSNSISLEVKPVQLEIQPYLKKTRVKLGGIVELHVVIWNRSKVTIKGVNISFEKDPPHLRLESYPERLEIPPGERRKARYLFKAIKTGKISPGRAIAFMGKQKIEDNGFSGKHRCGVSLNPVSQIQIDEVSLPGIEHPLRCHTKQISSYFSLLFLKILGVAAALLSIVILFARAINSRMVDSFSGRVLLWTLTVGAAEMLLIFLGYGISWCWRSTPPDLWTLGMIFVISSGMALFSGAYPLKNPIFGSLIAGSVLSLSAYLVFVGFSAMEITGFIGVPVKEAALLFIAISIAINSREFKRR